MNTSGRPIGDQKYLQADADIPALLLTDVSLSYGDIPALTAFNLSVQRHSITSIIGPNGAGKSSLVKAICGRRSISTGKIYIQGVDSKSKGARQALGVAPQRAALYDQLTARENLLCFARQSNGVDIHNRADNVLDLIGMREMQNARVLHMSGGMRQRVNIGAAIMHKPELIILDEPVASLDPAGTEQINILIRKLRQQGYGILLITHDMEQAGTLSDHVAIIDQGTIVAHATPETLIKDHCGGQVNLHLTTPDADLARKLNFQPRPEKSECWHKIVQTKSDLSAEIATMVQEGINLERLNIVPCHLGDVLNCITGETKMTTDPVLDEVAKLAQVSP